MKFCINNNIVPKHLYFLLRQTINLTHYSAVHKYERLSNLHTKRILRIELGDAFRAIHYSKAQILQLVRKMYNCIPIHTINSFFKKQEHSLYYFYT